MISSIEELWKYEIRCEVFSSSRFLSIVEFNKRECERGGGVRIWQKFQETDGAIASSRAGPANFYSRKFGENSM